MAKKYTFKKSVAKKYTFKKSIIIVYILFLFRLEYTMASKTESNTIDSDKIESVFNLPISYLHDKQPLAEHIKTDLELIAKEETSLQATSLYDTVFQPSTVYGKQTTALWSQYYTANKDFIKDSQQLIKQLTNILENLNI